MDNNFLWLNNTTRTAINSMGQLSIVVLTVILLWIDRSKTKSLQLKEVYQQYQVFSNSQNLESSCRVRSKIGEFVRDWKHYQWYSTWTAIVYSYKWVWRWKVLFDNVDQWYAQYDQYNRSWEFKFQCIEDLQKNYELLF